MKYILIASNGVDLYNVDGAPFNERYHLDDISDDKIIEIFNGNGSEFNRVLLIGEDSFNRVSSLIHFPIRRAKWGSLFGLNALTLNSGCKVKIQPEWNLDFCESIFREGWINSICPDTPIESHIFKVYNDEAKNSLKSLTNLPKGTLFGYDYETSGLPNEDELTQNYRYCQLQGRECEFNSYSGKTFQITGLSICSEDRKSYYFDFLSIINSDKSQEFFNDLRDFLRNHSEDCWTYNMKFETEVTFKLFNEIFIFQDAAIVNYIEGRNNHHISLKLTTQMILYIRSWDDAFDDLVGGLNYLLSDAFSVNWDEATVVENGVTYFWYQSPYFINLFKPYGDDMVVEAQRLAKDSFMNPFLCIPAEILGKYCNVDSYATMELARYCYNKYGKLCSEVFASNLRYNTYLNITGNFIDDAEVKRENDLANMASNWGMLLVFQFITKVETEEYTKKNDIDLYKDYTNGNLILNWLVKNNITVGNYQDILSRILWACLDYNYENQCNINILHEALPWDYTYEAIWKDIVAYGGLNNLVYQGRKMKKYLNGACWIIKEYGEIDEDTKSNVNKIIEYNKLIRRGEWLKYLCRLFPQWDSEPKEYMPYDKSTLRIVSDFKSSDGLPWYESPEFDNYIVENGIPTTWQPIHEFIKAWTNAGASDGMEYLKNMFLYHSDAWASMMLISWMDYDPYYYGDEMLTALQNNDCPDYDIWNKFKDVKILPQRLEIDKDGNYVSSLPILDDLYTEIPEEVDSPVGKIWKAVNSRKLPDEVKRISTHPEYLNHEMYELAWEGHIGERYLYTDRILNKDHLICMVNSWYHRCFTGYKDFMELCMISIGNYESKTLNHPWDWNKITSTRLDATGTKLDEIRPILGLFTWRKFRKTLGTYLKSTFVEGKNFTKSKYLETHGAFIKSEFTSDTWSPEYTYARGHVVWNCMKTHTKRWSSSFHTIYGESDSKQTIYAGRDKLFFYLDISQAEPRTLAYKSGDPLMKRWYEEGRDIYTELAVQFNPGIFNNPNATEEHKTKMKKELRGLYKVLVLAIMYGMGDYNLAEMTGKPLNEARRLKKQFLDAMPELEKFIKERMDYPNSQRPYVKTILGDTLRLYDWDKYRWERQGINFCIQEFSAIVLVTGFENMVKTAHHDGLLFSPIGTVHDSAQMLMDPRFIYNCQAHFDKNYTQYLYDLHGVKYKGDIKIGVDYYNLAKLKVLDETSISLTGTARSINRILRNLDNVGATDYILDIPRESIVEDKYSSIPKQVARTGMAGFISDKSKYEVKLTFGDSILNFHRNLVI